MRSVNARIRPEVDIFVVQKDDATKRGIVCRDEIDIHYRPDVLLHFFFRKPTAKVLDLLRIVASIAHADRRVPRRHSVCWERNLRLHIPVSDPEFWSEANTQLRSLLALLSGDNWTFVFRKIAKEIELPKEGYLDFPPNGDLATAYSNGLDSFAIARLVASGEIRLSDGDASKKNLVLVTTGQKIHLSDTYTQFGYRVRQISVPFTVKRFGSGFQLREASYRTRALVFQTIAALAAVQSQSNTVIVGEAGQGSLGPWLTVTGEEVADLRTHPLFTRQLTSFLQSALAVEVKFEHPLLWNTKGESLQRLVSANLHSGWQETHSCAVQVRHQKSEGRRLHCGMCPNCLLRRQSLLTANLDDPDSNYDFGSASGRIDMSLRKRVAQGLMPLIELACARATPLLTRVIDRQIKIISDELNLDTIDVEKRVNRLLQTHRDELRTFVFQLPTRSLLRKFGEALL